jgi:hypothetical protein
VNEGLVALEKITTPEFGVLFLGIFVGLVLGIGLAHSKGSLKAGKSNWLPAPAGNFSIWLRAYWPDQAILDGTLTPPVIAVMK